MKNTITRISLVLAALGTVALFQNCAKTEFSSDLGPTAIQSVTAAGTCTDGKDITKPTKIFLVVDASSSNISDPATNRVGTDDNKVWRAKVINRVVAKYGNNPHVSFGLVSFQGLTAGKEITAHIRAPGSNQPIFSNDMAVVQAGIDDFMKVVEGPYTPYPAAVAAAHDAIKADMDANPGENATYSIVMLTDGIPSQGRYDTSNPSRYPNALSDAAADTQAIMALSPNMIRFNGAYYYNDSNVPTAGSDTVLKKIVETGKGLFLTANTQPEYDLNLDTILKFEPAQCE